MKHIPVHLYINGGYLRTDIVSKNIAHSDRYTIPLRLSFTNIKILTFKLNYIAAWGMADEDFIVIGLYNNENFKWEDDKLYYLDKELEIK